jgi:hypothetical protein
VNGELKINRKDESDGNGNGRGRETGDWTDGGESQEEYYQMGSTRHK